MIHVCGGMVFGPLPCGALPLVGSYLAQAQNVDLDSYSPEPSPTRCVRLPTRVKVYFPLLDLKNL